MSTRVPGELIAARVAVLPDGDVAEVIVTERTGPYSVTLREAYGRWVGGGAWSAWRLVAEAVSDVSIAADPSGEVPAALISAVIFVPVPLGAIAANHQRSQLAHFRLTPDGVVTADL